MFRSINKEAERIDAYEKVTGRVKYAADITFGNQLYAKTVYSSYPHAEITSIDPSEAEQVPGVVLIITAADVPGKNEMFGRFPVLAEREVKHIGDGVAVVAAETPEAAEEAAGKVKVAYRELPLAETAEDALAPGAVLVHEDAAGNIMENTHYPMYFGDVEKGFAEADVVLEQRYTTHYVDQAYIEPEAIIALPDYYRRGVEIHGCIQNPYSIRQNVAAVLNLKMSEVKVLQSTIGGSFGGKDESVMLMAARLSVIAVKTNRPVKMVLTREESFLESCKRHPCVSRYKVGAKKDGTLTAVEDIIYTVGGAYNNKAMFANWRGSVHAAGPYRVPHVKTDLYGVYTHTVYGGAYRGFSAPQIVFCNESLMDELAEELGLTPKEIRLKNCVRPGDQIATGQRLDPEKMPAPLYEMIEDVCKRAGFDAKWKQYREENKKPGTVKRGIGLAVTFRGTGLGGEGIDTADSRVTIEKDGSVTIQSGLTEMGQGMRTAHAQIVAEVLGISLDRITFLTTDTSATMDGGPTVASRGTLAGGRAMMIAAEKLRRRLAYVAAGMFGCGEDEIVHEDNMVFPAGKRGNAAALEQLIDTAAAGLGLSLSAVGWHNPGPEHLDHKTGQGNAYPSYIYGAAVTEIRVDTGTGKIDVEKLTAAYEIGRAINPQIVKGQLMGGLLQGIGFGIYEEIAFDGGYMKTLNYDDYLIPTVKDIPDFDIILYETDHRVGPFGAKGVGEIGVELAAPSIANALYNATGRRVRELPMNLEKVLLGKDLRRPKGGAAVCVDAI
jgi:CO/xanthine dehydrogenase Mo-binding subunit